MPYKDKKSPAAIENNRKHSKAYYHKNKAAQLVRNATKKKGIKEYISMYKEYRGCMDCGQKYPSYVLDLDHRDPNEKKFTPSRLAKNNSWQQMMDELAKCDVVCANCHRIRTHDKNHYAHRNVKEE
jgi:hypothetical protein